MAKSAKKKATLKDVPGSGAVKRSATAARGRQNRLEARMRQINAELNRQFRRAQTTDDDNSDFL